MLMLHRTRELLVRQRTMRVNAVWFGIAAPQSIHRVEKLATQVHDPAVPAMVREALMLIIIAMSSSIVLRRSAKPGALTAATLRSPRSLLTTNVASASSRDDQQRSPAMRYFHTGSRR